jgi:HNH endonuclease
MARKGISKKLRFEVFKRDSFTCQYCGKKAPEVILHVDHIDPVAAGGSNELLNLITSCEGCNAGKSDRKISDSSALERQHAQMSALEERRQQIEMMAQWRAELENLDEMTAVMAEEAWHKAIENTGYLNATGKQNIRKWVKRHGLEAVFNGISAACTSYLERDEDGKFTLDSVNHAFNMVPRVMSVQRRSQDKPYLQRIYYARGILRNRLHYMNDRLAVQLMEDAISWGADVEKIVDLCKEVRNWSQFRAAIDDFIERERAKEDENGADS